MASSPEDTYVTMLLHLSRSLLCLGYVDQARLRREDIVKYALPVLLSYELLLNARVGVMAYFPSDAVFATHERL